MFRFRPLTPNDYPLLLDWLQRPHVKAWWNDGDDSIEKVACHYGTISPNQGRFIMIEWDGAIEKAIGLIQYELYNAGFASIDLFIGEANFINLGLGTRVLRSFIAQLIEQQNLHTITIDPAPMNTRAIRCYEKVGFRYYETCTNPDGTQAYMMKLDAHAFE